MIIEPQIKEQVRRFYDQVGWREVGEGLYQNARYEDLRPVAREYIHRCHLRVAHHLAPVGSYLLDAGSGPIQYPEYLAYSQGYRYRVCADISLVALLEARKRIGEHGLFVVADIANLPFRAEAFDGAVSLHTIHHLPEGEHLNAYRELRRVLRPGRKAVVVNGWPSSRLMRLCEPLVWLSLRLRKAWGKIVRRRGARPALEPGNDTVGRDNGRQEGVHPKGTFTSRHGVSWVKQVVGSECSLEILVWRSVSVRFLRSLVHPWLGGRFWLRMLYRLEERFPRWFGENGQYPLIIIKK